MYGKFPSFEDFLSSYLAKEEKAFLMELSQISREFQPLLLRKRRERDVVEVKGIITERQPDDLDGAKHHHIKIRLEEILDIDPDVSKDVLNCKNDKLSVFVSIRYGEKSGILNPITSGLDNGDDVHLRGEWIPKEKAYEHGGEKLSVLHFTHKPLGFVCTKTQCFD